jgi:hypothetical protein
MAKEDTPASPPAGRSDPPKVSAAAARLGLLLAKIRDELRQFLDAFRCAILGKGNINWHGFCLEVPDPGNGGTISFPEETPHVTLSNFAITRFNIPVSETDIDTAARCLEDFDLPHDAKRLRDEFRDLEHAFCSLGDWIQHSDGVATDRKFYAQACAATLWEHVNQLIGTVKAMSSLPPTADQTTLTEPEAGEAEGGGENLELSYSLEPGYILRWQAKRVKFTPIPYRLLEYLLSHRTADQDVVIEAVWGVNAETSENTLKSHLSKVRRLLLQEEIPITISQNGQYIELTIDRE